MNYEIVEFAFADGAVFETVKIWVNKETNEYRTFPAIQGNPAYDAFVEALAAETPTTK